MRYVYVAGLALSLLTGIYLGGRFFPRAGVREVVVGPTVEKEIVRVVTRTVPGKATVVTEIRERNVSTPAPSREPAPQVSPKAQYRVGLSLRPSAAELDQARVSVSRRLVGDLWGEAAYDLKHKDITLGVSYEF